MDSSENNSRKPRRTRGTPAYQFRNKFAFGWIGLGAVFLAAWVYTPTFKKINKGLCDSLFTPTEEEIDRRYLFSFPKPLTSREIQKRIDEGKEFNSQR
ncbi:uncharacterized protein LOC120777386 [Bactrocera tryoni]|uniref:uncharacterized protein LOC120777386 n=1 Tax=Bactrocera tryoni TaxID=59916 RepID=UPI001A982198|nr:uncharacterized protein LOC120777386 [Bactrocera tryoni]